MPKNYEKAIEYANNKDTQLFAGDFRPTELKHSDGSEFKLKYGAYEIHSIDTTQFIILYGEHYHPMVFYAEDVEYVKGLQIVS